MKSEEFQPLPGLDFDPESTQRPDFETRERQQSFEQVRSIFLGASYVLAGVSLIWVILMINSPEASMPKEAFYLHIAKASLCTVTLLTLCVSLLRFALRCRSQKNSDNKEDSLPDATSVLDLLRKIVELASKSSTNQ